MRNYINNIRMYSMPLIENHYVIQTVCNVMKINLFLWCARNVGIKPIWNIDLHLKWMKIR